MIWNAWLTDGDGRSAARRGRRIGAAGLALLSGALGGCASIGMRAPSSPPVPTPEGWNALARAGSLVRTARAGDDATLAHWWQQLNDPLLTSLVDRALLANPELRVAQARLREARAQRGLAAAPLLPSIDASLSGSGTKSGDTAALQSYGAGFDASWEPDLFVGTRRSVRAAEADVQATEASLHDTRVALVAEVALAFVDARVLSARLAIARDNLGRQTETTDLTRWRADAGLTSTLDVEQSRANLEQTRAQIPVLEASRVAAHHRLALLLGLAPAALDEELDAAGTIPSVPAEIAVGIPADTLRQRRDVRAAERSWVAAQARLGAAKAARYPSLRLSGSIGLDALAPGGLVSGATVTRSLLGGLTAPLFDRRRINRQIDVQQALEEQTRIAYEKTVLTALGDVEDALAALVSAQERRAALTSAAEAARNAALMARQRYTAGLADFQTVLDTERTVLSIEDNLTSSQGDGVTAVIRLYKALGGGWSPSVAATPTRSGSKQS